MSNARPFRTALAFRIVLAAIVLALLSGRSSAGRAATIFPRKRAC